MPMHVACVGSDCHCQMLNMAAAFPSACCFTLSLKKGFVLWQAPWLGRANAALDLSFPFMSRYDHL